MLASSLLMESGIGCEESVAMEQLILEVAKKNKKRVEGLETMSYQASIFDSIPYKLQAQQLLKMIEDSGKEGEDTEMKMLTEAYRQQQLMKMDELTKKDESITTLAVKKNQ